ncbi:MAG: ATP-binding protein [Oculatellaceae cyanobacterium Prado106]|nr:ATP-binding protein [Oculatellaceae cyanobacterium Prado106]
MSVCPVPLQRLLDHATDLIFIFGQDGHCRYVNGAGCRTLGYGAEELARLELADWVDERDRPLLLQWIHAIAPSPTEHPVPLEEQSVISIRLIHRTGEVIFVEGYLSAVHSDGQEPEIWSLWHRVEDKPKRRESEEEGDRFPSANLHDATECHKTETMLLKRERYLAALVEIQYRSLLFHESHDEFYMTVLEPLGQAADASRIYIFENHWDLDERLLMSQRAEWCADGIQPELDNPGLQCVPYDDFFPRWAELLANGEIINGIIRNFPETEKAFLFKQGILSILILPLVVDGDFFGFIGFDNCVEERVWDTAEIHLLRAAAAAISQALEHRRAEEELQAAYAEQRALFVAMDDLVLVRDARGLCTKILTPKARSLLYRPAEDMIGRTLHDTFEPEQADVFLDYIRQSLDMQKTVRLEYNLMIEEREVWLEASISPIDSNLVMWVVRDTTSRRKAQTEILKTLEKERQLNEMKSRFVSMVSHEIRTPLTTILTSADILQNMPCNPEEREDLFRLIQSAIQQMVQLLEDVLFIGVAESGQSEMHPTEVDLPLFCQRLIKETVFCDEQHHELMFKVEGDRHLVWLDEKLLWQILKNLLSNAIKYSPPDRPIDFDLIFQPDLVTFQIRDRGIGIPIIDRPRLFECFHRASNVGAINGSGLGLAIVRNCVDRLRGEISVNSAVGIGTTFVVTLPACQLNHPPKRMMASESAANHADFS